MAAAGLNPPELEPGKLVRFPGVNKPPTNRAGWAFLFADGRAGAFGCWATGLREVWHDAGRGFLSRSERETLRRQLAQAKRQADAERAERWANAAGRAREIWRTARPADPSHAYLQRKRIRPHCARQSGTRLVLPVCDFDGALHSLQFIDPAGGKLLLAGGRKAGHFIPVSGRRGAARVVVAEGYATGATLADAEPGALVLAAIDAGNLEAVAVAARQRYPAAEIVIACDADRVGIEKGRAAAIACGGRVAIPEFPPGVPGSDWNDFHQAVAGRRAPLELESQRVRFLTSTAP